jgi:hypothetical protein
MPLKGGAADKYGGRYEGLWTVSCLLDVMSHRADLIRLEPPGAEGKGVEFWIRKGDITEYHQVKRQRGRGRRWTLAALGSETVLTYFREKLNDPAAHCVFVSADGAPDLGELADRARSATSWAEFDSKFLSSEAWRQSFGTLRSLWGDCEATEAFEQLRRIHVRTMDEESLRSYAEVRLEPLVEGDPSDVADVLAQLALDRVHDKLRAIDIWQHLEERGHRRRDWGNDPYVLGRVEEANDRYLTTLRDEIITETIIPRTEAQSALDLLASPDVKRGVLLAGEAGVGKSGVVLQVLEGLEERRVPVLALRADRLEPTLLAEEVGRQWGLPGSPVAVLAAVAQESDSVLVIDQLDAVSLTSGRSPELFDVVREMIQQAEACPKMRLLLCCRRFDLDNDQRLRRLTGERGVATALEVGRLPEETIRDVVARLGIDEARLNPRQVELLSIPLHLRLLEEISDTRSARELDFRTANDLYDEFWRRKRQLVRARAGGRAVQWIQVVDALCDRMSERRILSAPVETLDDYEDDASIMASEHVLVLDNDRYAFFHESFFDYAFARRFAERSFELLPWLRGDEQHLFRRAQVRQILRREREADRDRYLDDLSNLLNGSDVRFHIKQVVFAMLADLNDPTREEWEILAPLMDGTRDPYSREIWGMLRSLSWFRLVDSLGLWERWLSEGNDERLDRLVNALWVVQKEEADRVAELVEPYVNDPAWHKRVAYLMQGADLHTGRRFFDLFLKVMDEGVLDSLDLRRFLHYLPNEDPERCCEALGRYFKRRLRLSLAAGQPNPFDTFSGSIPSRHYNEDIFMEIARGAPLSFVKELLPFILALAQGLMDQEGAPPWRDPIWLTRYHDGAHSTADILLAAMVAALQALAVDQPEAFDLVARELRGSDAETAQYLLVRSYAANGERYADEAVEYLLERPARLQTGYVTNYHWATRQLLEAVTPHCSDEHLAKLEELILGYYSQWEQSETGRDWRGDAQQTLLEGIAPSRRSPAVEERLEELREKFSRDSVELPPSVMGGFMQSPIPEEEAVQMTDQEWLDAITRYPEDHNA